MNLLSTLTAAKSSILTGLAVAAICTPLGFCTGQKAERSAWQAKIARIEAESAEKQRVADKAVFDARAKDAAQIIAERTEVDHALQNLPDATPSARQHARGCLQLVRQGTAANELVAAGCTVPAP